MTDQIQFTGTREEFLAKARTMTLNLSEKEMQVLEELAVHADISKTAVMRQALRLYQFVQPLYATPPPTQCDKAEPVAVTGALIDAGAHALDMGTDLSLSWEELCTVSELVLTAALQATP